ncbi:MAG: hypothetical protein ACJ738_00140 [Gaiellales bacterium]
MTLVHFLVDLGAAGVLTALLARVVELVDRGSPDDGPSDGGGGGGGGGGGWWRRPAPPAPRPHPTGARDRRSPSDTRPHDRPRPARVRVH